MRRLNGPVLMAVGLLLASLGSAHAQGMAPLSGAQNVGNVGGAIVPVNGVNGGGAQANRPTGVPGTLPPLPVPGEEINFSDLLRSSLGLTPEQIKEVRRELDKRQKAVSELPKTPPKPVTRSLSASVAPGAVPGVMRVFSGYASSLVVADSTGQPWPIENFAVGNKDLFEVERMDSGNGSTLSIVPLNPYASSNLVLYLKGLPTPVALSLVAGQKEVDFRLDLRVQGRGPNAQTSMAGLPVSTNNQLTSVLEGVAPSEARPLRVSSPEAQAWLTREGTMYLRTSLQVISPAWIGSMRSTDGMNAYELAPASSILILRDGVIERLIIEGM